MNEKQKVTHIHLDLVGGISGHMFVAAVLDGLISGGISHGIQIKLTDTLNALLPETIACDYDIGKGMNAGISGLFFRATLEATHFSHQPLANQVTSVFEEKGDDVNNVKSLTFQYLTHLIQQSKLNDDVKTISLEMLTLIATAEAKIQNINLDVVCLDNLMRLDNLIEIVAASFVINELKSTSWSLSKLPIGGGMVNTKRGLLPIPTPVVAELLVGFEFINDGIQGERITLVGAAILKYLLKQARVIKMPATQLITTGYGLGLTTLNGLPNIVRSLLFAAEKENVEINSSLLQDRVVIIECDIDDMTGEELAYSLDLLRQHKGVIDVVVQTGRGKKNRAVEQVCILAKVSEYQLVIQACFLQTSTIGLRWRIEQRFCLDRCADIKHQAEVKKVLRPDGVMTTKIEHDQLTHPPISTLAQRRAKKYNVESDG